jgi:hypothetical protein
MEMSCIRLPSGHGRKEGHFIAVPDRRIHGDHGLIHGCAQVLDRRQDRPGVFLSGQVSAQIADRYNLGRQFALHAIATQRFAQAGKEQDFYRHENSFMDA